MLIQPTAKISACSDGSNWTSLFASVQHERPFRGTFAPSRDHLLVLHRNGPVQIESLNDSRVGRCVAPAGSIHLVAPGSEFGISLNDEVETVHVYVRRSVIEEVALDLVDGNPARICIPSAIVFNDSILRALIETSAFALEGAREDAIFADHLARAIAGQLIRTCSTATLRGMALPKGAASWPSVLKNAVNFMASNIDRTISLADIASAANSSPSHIARVFRSELGMPTHRYLITMRVAKAESLLKESGMSIAQIAAECGFTHQEHLTRLFHRHLGTTPAAYRRSCAAPRPH